MKINEHTRATVLAALFAGAALATAGCNDRSSSDTATRKVDRAATNVAATTNQATTRAAVAVDDTAITTQVKAAVLAEPGLRSLQIEVDTKNGVVTLSGMVDNPALKERAAAIAHNVSGVRSVVDNLAVKSTG